MAVDPNIKKKADDIRNKIYGKEVRESLASGLEAMSTDVVDTVDRQSNVESQFQDVIENTTDKDVISAPEIIAARDGEANLKARLDKEKNEVTAQLAQTGEKVFYDSPVSSKAKRKLVAWIDDDGVSAFYDYFKGLYEDYGTVFNSAIVGSWIGNSNRMTIPQMQELQSLGFGFPPHGYSHDTNNRLGSMSESELHQEMKLARQAMLDAGLNSDVLVYGFGSHSPLSREVVRQYFKAGIDTRTEKGGDSVGGYNPSPYDQFAMQRIDVHKGNTRTFPIIEEASQENEPLIMMSHINQSGWLSDTEIRQLIQKLLDLGYEFVTIDELIMKTGNLAQFGETTISSDGHIGGGELGTFRIKGTHNNVMPNDYFPKSKVTSFKVTSANANKFGVPTAGRVYVHRDSEDYYTYQVFVGAQSNTLLYSEWDLNLGQWSEWKEFQSSSVGGTLYNNSTQSMVNVVKLSWDSLPTIPLAKMFVIQGAKGYIANATIRKEPGGSGVALLTYSQGIRQLNYDGTEWTETPIVSPA